MEDSMNERIKGKVETVVNNKKNISLMIFILCPVLTFYLTQNLIGRVFGMISASLQIVNWILFLLGAFFLLLVFGKGKYALLLEMFISWLFGTANAYVYEFRGTYITPPDLTALKTAANVAGNFNYAPTARVVIVTLLFILMAVLVYRFCDLEVKVFLDSPVKRVLGVILSAVLLFSYVKLIQNDTVSKAVGMHDSLMNVNNVAEKNGIFAGFAFKMKYLRESKPKGYSAEAEKEILDGITVEGEVPEDLPDIVVIMDEAFSDPKLNVDFETNMDYIPFIRSLGKPGDNTVTGILNVSVNGGKTPNTEFEFLTGNTIGFLTFEAIPFQTYLKNPKDGLGWYMQSLGYDTIAMHPFDADGWDRITAWPNLGFSTVRFKDYFKEYDPELVRDYISDKSHFERIIGELDNRKDADKPLFIFNVTMQNHSGYGGDPDNFERSVTLEGVGDHERKEVKRLENYLSLMHYTDDAFKYLLESLSKSDRKTLVVLFGDHQPSASVLSEIYALNGMDAENLSWEEDMKRFRVPFVIWANYDIEEKTDVETSANYLGNLMLKTAGIPLTRYRTFIDDFSREYPVITYERYVDSEGNAYPMDRSAQELQEYNKMEYYEIFDDNDSYY